MNKSILSVNGNNAIHYLLQTIFQNEYALIAVSDAFEATYQLKSKKGIGILIVDVDYDTDQNWEMIQHIKTSKLFQLPIVVLTTNNDDTVKNKCYEFGIDDVFFKPFNPVDLVAAVKSLDTAIALTNA